MPERTEHRTRHPDEPDEMEERERLENRYHHMTGDERKYLLARQDLANEAGDKWFAKRPAAIEAIEHAAVIVEKLNPGRGLEYLQHHLNVPPTMDSTEQRAMLVNHNDPSYYGYLARLHGDPERAEGYTGLAYLQYAGQEINESSAHTLMQHQMQEHPIFDPAQHQAENGPLAGRLAGEFTRWIAGTALPDNPGYAYARALGRGDQETAGKQWNEMLGAMRALQGENPNLAEFNAELRRLYNGESANIDRPTLEQLGHEWENGRARNPATEPLRHLLYTTVDHNLRPGGDPELAGNAMALARTLE